MSGADGAANFESVFNAYYSRLCEFVYRYVGSRDIAHELVQDLFLRLWELSDARRAPRLTAKYLYAAARTQGLKYLRHQRVVARWKERVTRESDASAASTDTSVQYRELAGAVDRAIAELPERCRLVFTLSRERELSNADIAKLLGISIKTVESQMTRALKILRGKLAPFLAVLAHIVQAVASGSGWFGPS